jgi:hypothetical protein
MTYRFRCGHAELEITERSEEALEKLLADPMMSIFMPYDSKDLIRKAFKESLKNGKQV